MLKSLRQIFTLFLCVGVSKATSLRGKLKEIERRREVEKGHLLISLTQIKIECETQAFIYLSLSFCYSKFLSISWRTSSGDHQILFCNKKSAKKSANLVCKKMRKMPSLTLLCRTISLANRCKWMICVKNNSYYIVKKKAVKA